MSIRLMSAIFESATLGPTERLVMLALADHADDEGRCYPSISRLCQRTGLSERAVQTNIRKLVQQGYIRIIPGGGKGNANLYFVSANPATTGEMLPRSGGRMPSGSERFAIYRRDRNTCVYCGYISPDGEENLTLDHVIPQSRGGNHSVENLVTCCMECNRRKKNKTPDEWGVKPRSRCTPHEMHPAADAPQTPQQMRANPAADAPEPSGTIIEPSRGGEEEGARATAGKRQSSQSLVAKMADALGFNDPAGSGWPKYWISADAALIASRWITDLGLTEAEVVEVAVANARQHGSPANGPKTLNRHMQDFAAAKSAPPLEVPAPPIAAAPTHRQHRPTGHGITINPEDFQ